MGVLKVRDPLTGGWQRISAAGGTGPTGPTGADSTVPGPTGPTGISGVSSIIVGSFGAVTTPADLPPDGLLPIDWDGPGKPTVATQMVQGESLYYDKPSDVTLDGHLYQYMTTAIDPAGWIDIGLIQGPAGPTGPIGDPGVGLDEMIVGPDDPSFAFPDAEFWYDTDEVEPPPAGMDAFLTKANIHAHFFGGPINSATATWTWTLAAGSYLCSFQASAVASVTGIRYVTLNMDGVEVSQSKHWFNAVNIHYVMCNKVTVITIPVDGDHTFTLAMSASATMDVNDFGYMTLIPCEPGAVH